MRQLRAVALREVASFFHANVGPVVLVAFLAAVGLFFTILVFAYSDLSLTAMQSVRSGNYLNLAEGLFRPLVANMIFFLLLLVPAITMRLFAPEYSSGRWDLVASWPVPDVTWVLGKWLAAVGVAGILVLASGAYFGAVWLLGNPEPGPLFASWIGLLLISAALAAWGVLASTLFRHQIVAYFLAFAISMFLFIVGGLAPYLPVWAGRICHEVSFFFHFERFSQGVLDSRDVLFFLGMSAVPLTAAVAVLGSRRQPAGRRLRHWLATPLVLGLAVVIYLLGLAAPVTTDLTANRRYSLAPQTLQVLDALPAHLASSEEPADEVLVYAFYQPGDPARVVTETLLKACAQRTRTFRYEVRDPEEELELVRRYGVNVARTLVVTAGARFNSVLQPEESALINAVYRVATGARKKVHHVLGHGEHLLDSVAISGYANYAETLLTQGYDLDVLQLPVTGTVPADAGIVVIAGPRTDPGPDGLAALEAHLHRGGSLLILCDPPTPPAWTAWLAHWRIGLTGDVIVSAERAATEYGVKARTVVVSDGYDDHEIAAPLKGVVTIFPMAQPLVNVGEPDSLVAGRVLLRTSQLTWAERDPDTRFSGVARFEPDTDQAGPLDLAYVLELHLNREGGPPGRMVVVGNSEFLNNANLNLGGNRDLLLNAMGWLGREEDLIALRGRDPLHQPVVLSDLEKQVLGWGSLVGWPLFVGSLALGVMLRHRRRGGA